MIKNLLSVIAIGRNEAENILPLYVSLESLLKALPCETIYVDSASTDESASIASKVFTRTIVLDESPNSCASAGRNVGARFSRGDWLLFLDGDMQLVKTFGQEIASHIAAGDECVGLVGTYVHVFNDGTERRWTPETDRSGNVMRFGGAVLLHRSMLQVENWDPRLYSNEGAGLI